MIDLIIGLVIIWLSVVGVGVGIWISCSMLAGIFYLVAFQFGFWLYAVQEVKNFRKYGTNDFKE